MLPTSGGGESLLTAIYSLHSPKRVDVHFDTSSIRYSINITLSLTDIGIHKTQGVALGYVHVGLAGLHYDFKLQMSVVKSSFCHTHLKVFVGVAFGGTSYFTLKPIMRRTSSIVARELSRARSAPSSAMRSRSAVLLLYSSIRSRMGAIVFTRSAAICFFKSP